MASSSEAGDAAYTVITTLRYSSREPFTDPETCQSSPFYRLPVHVRRLGRSATAAGWHYSPDMFWGSRSHDQIVAYLEREIPRRVVAQGSQSQLAFSTASASRGASKSRYPNSDPANDPVPALTHASPAYRVRLDLSCPSAGGSLVITVAPAISSVTQQPASDFDPFFPTSSLPDPSTLARHYPFDSSPAPSSARITTATNTAANCPGPSWKNIHLHHQPANPSLHTRHKTSQRQVYDEARGKHCDAASEVLLWNTAGEIMDGTLASVYFWRRGRWVTPALEAGGLDGVSRRWALDRGLAVEDVIEVASLGVHESGDATGGAAREVAEVVWLSNGFRGFGWGWLRWGPA